MVDILLTDMYYVLICFKPRRLLFIYFTLMLKEQFSHKMVDAWHRDHGEIGNFMVTTDQFQEPLVFCGSRKVTNYLI